MALKKYCNRTGCTVLVPLGVKYCSMHTYMETENIKESRKMYDQFHRNKEAKAFYDSAAWRQTRAAVLARDKGIDVYLFVTAHRTVPADTVHHIKELSEDYSKRFAMDNLISVSEKTHSMISRAYGGKDKKKMQETLHKCLKIFEKKFSPEGA